VAQVAIAWVLSRGDDVVPLVGARTRERLAESLGALEPELSADDLAAIEAALPPDAGGRRALRRAADGDPRQRALSHENMTHAPLTAEHILEAAERVLRRYGPDKANVVDVARELGVSHGSVYRHFPRKAALRDAVAERWLAEISAPLARVAAAEGPAPERLRHWLDQLVRSKQSRAHEDPSCSRPTPGSPPRPTR
jgi:Bacterial regulatory proteins, tetR family/Aldo/keto reductase family